MPTFSCLHSGKEGTNKPQYRRVLTAPMLHLLLAFNNNSVIWLVVSNFLHVHKEACGKMSGLWLKETTVTASTNSTYVVFDLGFQLYSCNMIPIKLLSCPQESLWKNTWVVAQTNHSDNPVTSFRSNFWHGHTVLNLCKNVWVVAQTNTSTGKY